MVSARRVVDRIYRRQNPPPAAPANYILPSGILSETITVEPYRKRWQAMEFYYSSLALYQSRYKMEDLVQKVTAHNSKYKVKRFQGMTDDEIKNDLERIFKSNWKVAPAFDTITKDDWEGGLRQKCLNDKWADERVRFHIRTLLHPPDTGSPQVNFKPLDDLIHGDPKTAHAWSRGRKKDTRTKYTFLQYVAYFNPGNAAIGDLLRQHIPLSAVIEHSATLNVEPLDNPTSTLSKEVADTVIDLLDTQRKRKKVERLKEAAAKVRAADKAAADKVRAARVKAKEDAAAAKAASDKAKQEAAAAATAVRAVTRSQTAAAKADADKADAKADAPVPASATYTRFSGADTWGWEASITSFDANKPSKRSIMYTYTDPDKYSSITFDIDNGDRYVMINAARTELLKELLKRAKIDKNGDNQFSAEELKQFNKRLDSRKGLKENWEDALQDFLATVKDNKVDTNNDNQFSVEELATWQQEAKNKKKRRETLETWQQEVDNKKKKRSETVKTAAQKLKKAKTVFENGDIIEPISGADSRFKVIIDGGQMYRQQIKKDGTNIKNRKRQPLDPNDYRKVEKVDSKFQDYASDAESEKSYMPFSSDDEQSVGYSSSEESGLAPSTPSHSRSGSPEPDWLRELEEEVASVASSVESNMMSSQASSPRGTSFGGYSSSDSGMLPSSGDEAYETKIYTPDVEIESDVENDMDMLRPSISLKDEHGTTLRKGDMFTSKTSDGMVHTFMLMEVKRNKSGSLISTDFNNIYIQDMTTSEELLAQGYPHYKVHEFNTQKNMTQHVFPVKKNVVMNVYKM